MNVAYVSLMDKNQEVECICRTKMAIWGKENALHSQQEKPDRAALKIAQQS